MCRYALRPPVAGERLHLTGDGQVRLSLRQPWRDGTTDLVFTPMAFLERLAVLVPRPRINLMLYFGALGARSARRKEIVGGCRADAPGEARRGEEGATSGDDGSRRPTARGQQWAALMQRIFGVDVLACPRCGGRLRLLALIEKADVIRRILEHLGWPTDLPACRPARPPPDVWAVEDGDSSDLTVFTPAS